MPSQTLAGVLVRFGRAFGDLKSENVGGLVSMLGSCLFLFGGDIGGLIVSQGLTLYTTPVIYLLTDTLRLKIHRRRHGGGQIAEAAG